MADEFSISVEGVPKLRAIVTRWDVALKDMAELLPEADDWFRRLEAKAFDSEGSSQGRAWDGLRSPYKEWKSAAYPGKKILERTGDLKASLIRNGYTHIAIGRKRELIFGSKIPYARHHQRKGKYQRPPISFTNKDANDFTKMWADKLRELAKVRGAAPNGRNNRSPFANLPGGV